MKVSVFIATSLDGFIARPDGSIDWMEPTSAADAQVAGEDYGYAAFMATVDALVMGRKTFEKVLTFGVPWPFGERPVVVLSRGVVPIPAGIASTVSTMAGEPAEILGRLSDRGIQHVYLDGGETIRGFLRAGLVDTLILTRIPILLGAGIPLFGHMSHDIVPRHIRTNCFANGFVQSEYAI